jgi:hypothetical protein
LADHLLLHFYDLGRIAQNEFLVRQAKLEESGWLRSQRDKVSRPSEPSFAFMQVTAWVKRKRVTEGHNAKA